MVVLTAATIHSKSRAYTAFVRVGAGARARVRVRVRVRGRGRLVQG
jgi:hypothetical protein